MKWFDTLVAMAPSPIQEAIRKLNRGTECTCQVQVLGGTCECWRYQFRMIPLYPLGDAPAHLRPKRVTSQTSIPPVSKKRKLTTTRSLTHKGKQHSSPTPSTKTKHTRLRTTHTVTSDPPLETDSSSENQGLAPQTREVRPLTTPVVLEPTVSITQATPTAVVRPLVPDTPVTRNTVAGIELYEPGQFLYDDSLDVDQAVIHDIQLNVPYDTLDDVMDVIAQQDNDWMNIDLNVSPDESFLSLLDPDYQN